MRSQELTQGALISLFSKYVVANVLVCEGFALGGVEAIGGMKRPDRQFSVFFRNQSGYFYLTG